MIILVLVFIRLKISPFGEASIWYIDLPAQLTMFYHHLYDVLTGSSSAIYTWNYGLGTSFWATICYYLSSPLSLLILVFPRSFIPFSILMIWMIKIGLSSLTMSYLLKKHFTQNHFTIFIFSISYALMSFSITYYFLPMWLDAIYLLPIIIAGIQDILKSEKYTLFLISLSILFIANFYISYMVGIFVFLYFVAECYVNIFTKKDVIKRFILFFKGVFLAVLFTSFITIPTYLELRKNKYTSEDTNLFTYLLNPLDLYGHFFNGTTELQNLSIYAGVGAVLLVPLYFLNQKYAVRERIIYGLLLGFLLYCMTNGFLNRVWHVFEVPAGANYRYAFVVSFLMLILSVKALEKLEYTSPKRLIGVAGYNILFLCMANKLLNQNIFTIELINMNILILICYAIFFFFLVNKRLPKRVHVFSKVCLCFLVLGDMGLNSQFILRNYTGSSGPYNWYNKNNPSYETAIASLQSLDQSFYRIKIDTSLVSFPNESLRYKYKGMTIYTSTGRAENNMFLNKLGYSASTRAVSMENGIFLSDALLGFKYIVTTKGLDERIYTKMFEEGNIKVYKININLPLGYMVNKGFMNVEGQSDIFNIQNRLIDGSAYYEKQKPQTNLNSLTKGTNQVLQIQQSNDKPSIEASMKISNTRELYMQLDSETYQDYEGKMDILVNNEPIDATKVGLLNLIDLGTYENQDVTVSILLKNNTPNLQMPIFYTLNYSSLEKEVNKLNQNSLKIKDYSDTKLKGEITVQNNQEMLFLSIPYDKNWRIKVDGTLTEYQKIGEFIGVKLEKGTHIVHLKYVPKILYISMGVSAFSVLVYLTCRIVKFRRNSLKKKEGK
ncbi:YfhO family protein [Bacillus sp. 03113]|uniref:YfhO family protein n=1 Tax=Bacillus sp. 03113 TaxID=2578211 RepID=UPI00215CBAA9|nr:YfhO family protein [Bacillus sp. 03113]